MQFNSPFQSLGQLMFTPGQTAQASAQNVNELGRSFNPMTGLKAQSSTSGIGRSLKAALAGQGGYDAQRRMAPIAQQFTDAQSNADYSRQLQGANAGYGLGMLGRTLSSINQNNSPSLPLAVANTQLNNFNNAYGWLGQLMSGW